MTEIPFVSPVHPLQELDIDAMVRRVNHLTDRCFSIEKCQKCRAFRLLIMKADRSLERVPMPYSELDHVGMRTFLSGLYVGYNLKELE